MCFHLPLDDGLPPLIDITHLMYCTVGWDGMTRQKSSAGGLYS